ncbi:MAG: ampC [Polaromonas sp.]|nr:ampC [Polaromonas sp.]
MILRRQFTAVACFGLVAASLTTARNVLALPANAALHDAAIQTHLRELESAAQGRLGIHIVDAATGLEYGYRSDERFMMLSSFKLLASALVLHRVDTSKESLTRRIAFTGKDLISWSPVTEQHADGNGMTLAQLCEATITTSDNTAANLILSSCGGPAALTAFARQLGDQVTRLDRNEPQLNVKSGDGLMDTTSPRAMATTMQKLLLGEALSVQSRGQLQLWLRGNTTGNNRLKAGLPADWRIGDKTGTNQSDSNDIGIVFPPDRTPLLVAAYLAESHATSQVKDATIAAVGQLVHEIGSHTLALKSSR